MVEKCLPSEADIFEAEHQRAIGNVKKAAVDMRSVLMAPLEEFEEFTKDEQKRVLMSSRILVGAEMSLAKRSWDALDVVQHLDKAKVAIETVYRQPEVLKEVSSITTDTRGSPYEFKTEMRGDEAGYLIVLSILSGDEELSKQAMGIMKQLAEEAWEGTAKGLAQFRLSLANFEQEKTDINFIELNNAYRATVGASGSIGNWERVATVSARYSIAALTDLRLFEFIKGIGVCLKSSYKDRSTLTIFPRELAKKLTDSVRHWNWRRTSGGLNLGGLKLKD